MHDKGHLQVLGFRTGYGPNSRAFGRSIRRKSAPLKGITRQVLKTNTGNPRWGRRHLLRAELQGSVFSLRSRLPRERGKTRRELTRAQEFLGNAGTFVARIAGGVGEEDHVRRIPKPRRNRAA